MTLYFGEPLDAPIYEEATQVETPVGESCLYCGEIIEKGDRGFVRPLLDEDGPTTVPTHWECDVRAVIGSVAHVEERCSCYGGIDDDPPGMTKREAALAAVIAFSEKHGLAS